MRQTTSAVLLCSLLIGTVHAVPDSHGSEVNPAKRVFPDLFAEKVAAAPVKVQNTSKPETSTAKKNTDTDANKPSVNIKAISTNNAKTGAKQVSSAAPSATKPAVTESTQNVVKAVEAWVAAWSAKDADKYLTFYARDFHTPDGKSRAEWETKRRERIAKPAQIAVEAKNIKVDFTDETHATVKFHQSYQASHLKSADHKTLLMIKSGETWTIQDERTN